MSRHASLDDLASFIEGALRPRKTGRIASHLAGCSLCTGYIQDLKQVPAMLASIAYPPIPDELCSRIELAIATESVTRVTVTSDGGQPVPALAGTDGTVSGEASRRDLPERRHRRKRRGWRLPGLSSPLGGSLAAVGAAVVIAGGGYAIASHLSSPATTSSGSSGSAKAPANSTFHAQAGPANGPSVRIQEGGQVKSVPSVVTKTNFDPEHLQAQAESALDTARATRLRAAPGDVTSPLPLANSAATGSSAQLSQCVSNIAAGRNVLLVDLANYQSVPATIIVIGTAPDGPGTIYAVGAKCTGSDKDILGQQPLPAPSH
jgi:hypothetical protein